MTPYYEQDGITIYHGDARDVSALIAYDAILTDPPYGIGIKYGDSSKDTDEAFRDIAEWLADQPVPTVFTVPSTKIHQCPKPQWIGVWHKPMTFGFWSTTFIPHWEALLFYGMPKAARSDVWTFNPAKPNGHPTPKPIELWRELLGVIPGDVILDPFMGSGTTLRAAKDLGRKAIGIEIEERYCEIAVKRLQQAVLPMEVPV